MIRYKTNINIKDYYLASFVGLKNGGLKSTFFISLLISAIVIIISTLGNTKCHVSSFSQCLIFFSITFIFELIIFTFSVFLFSSIIIFLLRPLIKFLFARFYIKQKNIEYFFNSEEFGWEIAGNKLSYKRELIDYIKIYPKYFLIRLKLKKIILPFVADKKIIKDVANKLRKTLYKEYIS